MSYGTNAPQGLVIKRYLNGTPYNGATNDYQIASGYPTNIFTDDPVIPLSDGTIGIGVAGSPCLGTFQGCKYTSTLGVYTFSPYWPASTTVQTGTTVTALIADDPNLVFSVQETNGSSAAGTPLALADRNLNINFAVGSGNTATGKSTTSINNTTEQTTSTLNLKILGLDNYPGNVVGSFANWEVTWNAHVLKSAGTTGV